MNQVCVGLEKKIAAQMVRHAAKSVPWKNLYNGKVSRCRYFEIIRNRYVWSMINTKITMWLGVVTGWAGHRLVVIFCSSILNFEGKGAMTMTGNLGTSHEESVTVL